MENTNSFQDLSQEIGLLLKETRNNDFYLYSLHKSHQLILTYHGSSYTTMFHEYQLEDIIKLLNTSPNVVENINIQIYEIGRTVYRNF